MYSVAVWGLQASGFDRILSWGVGVEGLLAAIKASQEVVNHNGAQVLQAPE